ncbi:Uncharacterised protein [Staphylococcus argenteus]|uniref:Uncharacterized protein n=1 Tax=Staphylococcus argenteus TaxID=985002 RepID=A0A7U7PX63_9STAP|nr:hypothetical protein HMPREF1276_01649 [Staphylococcus aureus subsp. aureus KPL1845]EYG84877.1 hypothetical protein V676_02526 [Staphylococcus argenteus]BBN30941.1 hypothetical protein KUH140087_1812 [Staphylococcus aureus]EYL86302.1 hypothetical protein V694_01399 [Staphylococcus argenteus]CCE57915.1 hypothetical protein SAMSHR1132_00620 [Staphylococcus argenteus]
MSTYNYEEVVKKLECVDEYILQDKIKRFRNLDIRNMNNNDLNKEIFKTLCDGKKVLVI